MTGIGVSIDGLPGLAAVVDVGCEFDNLAGGVEVGQGCPQVKVGLGAYFVEPFERSEVLELAAAADGQVEACCSVLLKFMILMHN